MRTTLLLIILALLIPAATLGQILFEEDFSDRVADGFTPDHDVWTVTKSGRYRVELEGYEVFSWNHFGDPGWTNYSVEVDMRSRYSANHIVAVRVQPNGDCYVVNLRSRPFEDAVISKYLGGAWQHHVFAPVRVRGEWQRLRVEAVGPTIALLEGNQEVARFTDRTNPLLQGSAALVALAGGMFQHHELFVDRVEVTGDGFKLAVPTEGSTWSNLKAIYR